MIGQENRDHAQGWVFMPEAIVLMFDELGWSYRRLRPEAPYYAMGSGTDYCYGAMSIGASAEEAVRAALIHETCSGGPIVTLRHFG